MPDPSPSLSPTPPATGRRHRLVIGAALLAAIAGPALLLSGGGTPVASGASRPAAARSVPGPVLPVDTRPAAQVAAHRATVAFRTQIAAAADAFVSEVATLEATVGTGDTATARSAELAAQADYDRFRAVEDANAENASTLDELVTEVPAGASFGGLHALEEDLWATPLPDPAGVASALVSQAGVARFLLSRTSFSPEAIGLTAVTELSWVVEVALAGEAEPYSHRDLVDVVASVAASHQAFLAIEPLTTLVDAPASARVDQEFAELDGEVAETGDPAARPVTALSPAVRLALAQDADAAAGLLAPLAARLAPFGGPGSAS